MCMLMSRASPVAAVLGPRHPSVHEAHEAAEVSVSQPGHLEARGQVIRVREDEAGQKPGLEAHNRSEKIVQVKSQSSVITLSSLHNSDLRHIRVYTKCL